MYLLRQLHFFLLSVVSFLLSLSFILLILMPNSSHLPLVFQPAPVPYLLCSLLQLPGWTPFLANFNPILKKHCTVLLHPLSSPGRPATQFVVMAAMHFQFLLEIKVKCQYNMLTSFKAIFLLKCILTK